MPLPNLDNFNEEEKKIVENILKEMQEKGTSPLLNSLKYQDYELVPVDVETFITNDYYLGQSWVENGKSKLYPYWLKVLKDIFPDNITTNYDTLLESGARGLGKSEIACAIIAPYLMYRIMCLKNPHLFYHLKVSEKIAFAFMNIKIDLTEAIALDKFQKTVQKSPFFMERGRMTTYNNNPYWVPPEPLEIIVGSQSDDVIGRPIFFAFFDEISFLKNQDIEKQKQKARDMIDTAIGGMKTRFIYKGKNPTLLVVASSKRSEQSFMEEYIRLKSETEHENVYIVDKPVWEVKPEGTYSDKRFYIGLGNKRLDNIVIPDKEINNLQFYKDQGYQIIEAPIDFKAKALEDIERMLCDYAGISSFSSNKFISAGRLAEAVTDTIQNPFPDVIEVGNGREDTSEYKNFFDLKKLPKQYLSHPLCIHLDMSYSSNGDKTGIAGVWIIGKKPTSDGNPSKDLIFQPAFSVSIKPPKGRQISFEKNRNFIRWLRDDLGLNIKEVTADTFQSAPVLQQLEAEGFKVNTLSVDRVDNVPGETMGICKPYQYLKNAIYEGRFKLYKTELLYNELVQLEKNNNNGKIDHPTNGSKDQADAVCGALYTASKYADEFAYDYGENYDAMLSVNEDSSVEQIKQQMIVDFEKELLNSNVSLNNLNNNDLYDTSLPDDEESIINYNNNDIFIL